MSDQNTNTTDQGTVQATDATPVKVYASKAEAEANKPADATKNHKVFEVSKARAVVGYCWSRGYDPCLAAMARKDGYSASTGNSAPVTKEVVLAKLGTLTDDELAAMGLTRKPQKGKK